MNSEFLNVNEIKNYSTLSQKQIRNNLNYLLGKGEYSNLIYGGGRGKGGQFRVHYTLIPLITNRKRNSKKKELQLKYTERFLSEFYYGKTNWDYFGCIKPNQETDLYQLVNSLQNFFSFYVIHRKKEKNHIHFTLSSSKDIQEVKELLKVYYIQNNISIDRVYLTRFVPNLKRETIDYLLRRGNHTNKDDLIDWGLVIPK